MQRLLQLLIIIILCGFVLSKMMPGQQPSSSSVQKENISSEKQKNGVYEAGVYLRLLQKAAFGDAENQECLKQMRYQLEKLAEHYPQSEEYNTAKYLYDTTLRRIESERDWSIKIQEERRAEVAAAKKRSAKAQKRLRTTYDKMQKITWTQAPALKKSPLQLYFGCQKDGMPEMRCIFFYHASDWIFFNKIEIFIDGETWTVEMDSHPNREVGGGVTEYLDIPCTGDLAEKTRAIAKGKDTLVRFSGKTHYADKKITPDMRQGLQDILDVFLSQGGLFTR